MGEDNVLTRGKKNSWLLQKRKAFHSICPLIHAVNLVQCHPLFQIGMGKNEVRILIDLFRAHSLINPKAINKTPYVKKKPNII